MGKIKLGKGAKTAKTVKNQNFLSMYNINLRACEKASYA